MIIIVLSGLRKLLTDPDTKTFFYIVTGKFTELGIILYAIHNQPNLLV